MKAVAARHRMLCALISIACAVPAQGQVNQAWVAYYDAGEREEAVDVAVASRPVSGGASDLRNAP